MGSPAADGADPPWTTIRCASGNATAAPHSGAAGPDQARKCFVSGAIAMRTCARGRGSPGNVSCPRAEPRRERASRTSRGWASTEKRPPSNRTGTVSFAGREVGAWPTRAAPPTRAAAEGPTPVRSIANATTRHRTFGARARTCLAPAAVATLRRRGAVRLQPPQLRAPPRTACPMD